MAQNALPVTLQIEPQAIPALRRAYEDAVIRVSEHLGRLRREGVIGEPWLGDETSMAAYETYDKMVMRSAEGPYKAMIAYLAELSRIHDQLEAMEDAYRNTDEGNASLWGPA